MNLSKIFGHTVDVDLLPEVPVVLDAGSRDFSFAKELRLHRPHAVVFAMDPDPSIAVNENFDTVELFDYLAAPDIPLIRLALVGDNRNTCKYAAMENPEGRFLYEGSPDPYHYNYGLRVTDPVVDVPCINISTLMSMDDVEVPFWDLVKLDIEGSEFQVLENWPGPIAHQISVEFHDWWDQNRWSAAYYERLLAGPLKDYKFVQHELQGIGGNTREMGHWDSLLRLR